MVQIGYRQAISEEFHENTILKNDVNMAAFGEYNYRSIRPANILYVSCGMGIGSGLDPESESCMRAISNSAAQPKSSTTSPLKARDGTESRKHESISTRL
jgi:hypothetical protein